MIRKFIEAIGLHFGPIGRKRKLKVTFYTLNMLSLEANVIIIKIY